MDASLFGARLVLAAVFVAAATAKLLDRGGGREALAGFGLSVRLVGPVAALLPVAEVSVAAALVPRVSAWWGGLGALGLLVVFTVAIALNLARGNRPECRCFGQLRATPVGWTTLLRNGVLAGLALFVVGAGWNDPGPSAGTWLMAALPPGERWQATLGLLALGFLGALIAMVARVVVQQARIMSRLDAIEARLEEGAGAPVARAEAMAPEVGLPVGAPAPVFALPDSAGEVRSLGALLARRRPVLLLFVGPGCDPCTALAPEMTRWQREHDEAFTMALISSGSRADNRVKFGGLASDAVLLQARTEVADAYAAHWTPGAVLIERTGRIASPVAFGDVAIRDLVAHAAASPGAQQVVRGNGRQPTLGSLPVLGGPLVRGQLAPPLVLPDLDGQTIDLRTYRGRDTLLVFWRPDCPHCQHLTEDLHRWEAEPPRGAPRLLVISSGSIEANRALGFRSSVVLDTDLTISKAFGSRGTPSAVLVDAEGRIASTVGLGARNVLALAGVAPTIESPGTRPPMS